MAIAVLAALTAALAARVGTGGAAERSTRLAVAPVADTYVSYAAPHTPHGVSERLTAGSLPGDRKVIYLRFRVDASAGSTLTDARVTLTRDEHHLSGRVELRAVADLGWDEATLDAATAPPLGALLDSVAVGRDTTTVSLDASGVVRGPGGYSFAVTSPAADDVARFRSREYGARYGAAGPTLAATMTTAAGGAPTTPTGAGPSTSAPGTPLPTVGSISPTGSTAPAPSPTSTAPPGPPGPGPGRPTCVVSAKLVPSCGRWWGIVPSAFTAQQGASGLRTAESLAGRPFDVYHAYHVNTQLFPTAEERGIALQAGRNRLLYLNWKPATDMTWRQVADGAADSRIDRLAGYIRGTFPYRFFLTIWHEPENDVNPAAGSGRTAADYAAMFRHTVQRLRADGVDNAVVVMNYMGYPGWNNQSWFGDLYPGDDVVDWIGWDPYGSGAASGYLAGDFAKLVNRTDGKPFPGFYTWVTQTHASKPIMLAEWGISEDLSNPTGKARYFQSVAAEISRFPRFKALLYFDTKHDQNGGFGDTSLDSSATTLAAFRALSADPSFVGPQVVAGS